MARKPKPPVTGAALQGQPAEEHAAEPVANPNELPLPSDDVPLDSSTSSERVDARGVGRAETQPAPGTPHPATARGHAEQYGGRRGVEKRVVNGVHLNLTDDGNYGGMGVVIDVQKPEDKPAPDETAILKEGGLRYRDGEWRGQIDRRDPAGSRNATHRTFEKFADKYAEREGKRGPSR